MISIILLFYKTATDVLDMPTMTRRKESLNVYAEYHCSSYGYSYSIYVYIYKQLHPLSLLSMGSFLLFFFSKQDEEQSIVK